MSHLSLEESAFVLEVLKGFVTFAKLLDFKLQLFMTFVEVFVRPLLAYPLLLAFIADLEKQFLLSRVEAYSLLF